MLASLLAVFSSNCVFPESLDIICSGTSLISKAIITSGSCEESSSFWNLCIGSSRLYKRDQAGSTLPALQVRRATRSGRYAVYSEVQNWDPVQSVLYGIRFLSPTNSLVLTEKQHSTAVWAKPGPSPASNSLAALGNKPNLLEFVFSSLERRHKKSASWV